MSRRLCPHVGCDYPQAECDGACMHDWLQRHTPQPDARRTSDSLLVAAICLAGMVVIAVAGVVAALLAHLVA